MLKRVLGVLVSAATIASVTAGCYMQAPAPAPANPAAPPAQVTETVAETATAEQEVQAKKAKYVFMFIGDGMSHVQVNATQVLLGNNTPGEIATRNLNFTKFPYSGIATTHDATSFCPDSASTATAYSAGVKTHSGVIGMAVDKTTVVPNISEMLKSDGRKIGIVSTVSINHATPAAYYAHNASRNEYYDIAMQLANSGFDYFGGGAINQPTGKDKDQPDAYEVIAQSGYKLARTKEEILALSAADGKVYAVSPSIQDSSAMPYAIDTKEGDLSLSDYVKKGIDVLDNDNGFMMMCESGKVDWACHANDAMSALTDVVEFESAIQVAIDFAAEHPDETLIIVTGDHETGGMTIGYAATGYDTAFSLLGKQKMSYVAFDELIGEMKAANPAMTFEDIMPVITENFGLITPQDPLAQDEANKAFVLSELEYAKLQGGFAESMKPADARTASEQSALLYGEYDPLSVSLTHILNNKAGIGWTSYSHTGTPVPVYAMGAGAETFGGSYDNIDVFSKMVAACGL